MFGSCKRSRSEGESGYTQVGGAMRADERLSTSDRGAERAGEIEPRPFLGLSFACGV
jgi:hypothetical protein